MWATSQGRQMWATGRPILNAALRTSNDVSGRARDSKGAQGEETGGGGVAGGVVDAVRGDKLGTGGDAAREQFARGRDQQAGHGADAQRPAGQTKRFNRGEPEADGGGRATILAGVCPVHQGT